MLSSSKVGEGKYLEQPKPLIIEHLKSIKDVLFVPYAGVAVTWNDYTDKVQSALPEFAIKGIHQYANPKQAIEQASAIMIGGGNTFNLLAELYNNDLIEAIKNRVKQGIAYVGWSAGSNICGLSIKTTNDMPIVQPASFAALSLINVQLNPHYTNYVTPGHNGETRDQRINEFCVLEPTVSVIGIQEGSAILLKDNKATLVGDRDGVVFKGTNKTTLASNRDISALCFA